MLPKIAPKRRTFVSTNVGFILTSVHPKLPMRNKEITKEYYVERLGFLETADYGDYLIIEKDEVELHFFEFKDLDPASNYGQVYFRSNDIQLLYNFFLNRRVEIHPNGALERKPWGQIEFSLLDPDHNLLTFGQVWS